MKSALFTVAITLLLCIPSQSRSEISVDSLMHRMSIQLDTLEKRLDSISVVNKQMKYPLNVDRHLNLTDTFIGQASLIIAFVTILFLVINVFLTYLSRKSVKDIKDDARDFKEETKNDIYRFQAQLSAIRNELRSFVEGERSEISSLMGEIRSEFEEYQQDLQQASERAQTSIANLVQYVQSLTEDENLRRSLEAIRYRLMLDSEIGEERTQAINGLAFVGDQEDLVRLTGIRNNPEENGTVRLAADEAIRSIRERLNLPDDDES